MLGRWHRHLTWSCEPRENTHHVRGGESPDTLQALPQGPSRLALEGRYAFHIVFQERWSFLTRAHIIYTSPPLHIYVLLLATFWQHSVACEKMHFSWFSRRDGVFSHSSPNPAFSIQGIPGFAHPHQLLECPQNRRTFCHAKCQVLTYYFTSLL